MILFDYARILGGLAALAICVITPYLMLRHAVPWHQRTRYAGAGVLAISLAANVVQTFGTVPPVAWRFELAMAGAVLLAIGTVGGSLDKHEPEEPEVKIIDRMHNVPAAFIVASELGQIVTASGMTEKITGWKPEALIGRPLATIIPAQFVNGHFRGMARVSATKDITDSAVIGKSLELAVQTKTQGNHPCQLTVLALPQQYAESPLQFLGIIISDHK